MARDYYEVLGISRDAGADEVQQAYRKLARRHHPDVNKSPDAEEKFKEINEAYQVLKDPEMRRRYDRFGANFRQVPEGYEEMAGAGRGAGAAASAAVGPAPVVLRTTASGISTTPASTSRTCSAGCSVRGVQAGRFPAPIRRLS